ncbi:MAG TPA: AraC family transcriptional regulator [Allosphingosinicella sp.]|jgi:AraC family transcriptional regulator
MALEPLTTRTAVLESASAFELRLGTYSPGSYQAPHAHSLPVVSLILSGRVGETVGRREGGGELAWMSVKPPDVRHSDAYGPEGAIILSAVIRDPALWALSSGPSEWRWRPLAALRHREIVSHLAAVGRGASGDDLVSELLATAVEAPAATGAPPAWLRRVAERLREEPEVPVASIAAAEGVHRVYLARSFRRWYGVSPRTFRRRAKTSTALGDTLFRGEPPARSAHGAGFADQSHMARAIREATGLPLFGLRALLGPTARI